MKIRHWLYAAALIGVCSFDGWGCCAGEGRTQAGYGFDSSDASASELSGAPAAIVPPTAAAVGGTIAAGWGVPSFYADGSPGPLIIPSSRTLAVHLQGDWSDSELLQAQAAVEKMSQLSGFDVRLVSDSPADVEVVRESEWGGQPEGQCGQSVYQCKYAETTCYDSTSITDDVAACNQWTIHLYLADLSVYVDRIPGSAHEEILFYTLTHEIGHSLGLQHTNERSIMYPAPLTDMVEQKISPWITPCELNQLQLFNPDGPSHIVANAECTVFSN